MDESDDVSLLDMEASIEHLGRGTPDGVDALIIVVEPYYRALETASRIAPLARELGIQRLVTVANKIRDDEDARVIREFCKSRDLEIVQEIRFDESVREADRKGISLIDHDPNSSTVRAVGSLADQLVSYGRAQ